MKKASGANVGKQPQAVQEHIKELLEAGFDPTTIHRRLKVGRSSIYRMKRCLQQHGTAYMPVEMNKKNGRPKVLTAEQELEVRDWLRDPKNRNRYLDDLVWLIHDRFNIVCSTTTMSKLKRKWLHVIECEESGEPLDAATRRAVMETHPDLPILHQASNAPTAQMLDAPSAGDLVPPHRQASEAEHDAVDEDALETAQAALQHQRQYPRSPLSNRMQPSPQQQMAGNMSMRLQQSPQHVQIDPRFQLPQHHANLQLEQELQREMVGSSAEPSR